MRGGAELAPISNNSVMARHQPPKSKGPPDAAFAKESGLNWFFQQVMRLLSFGIRKKAKKRGISYSFVFMRANGEQLSKITSLIDVGIIRPVVDRVFQFAATSEALAYLERGRAKGKVVVGLR
jgi:NADPH:quinone reductase-like Zn-dependent oxidoreductase